MVILTLGLCPSAMTWVGSHYGLSFFIGGSPTLFIERTFGLMPLNLHSEPIYTSFSILSVSLATFG